MILRLHQLCIHLQSEDDLINQGWQHLFAAWSKEGETAVTPHPVIDIQLNLSLMDALPPLPTAAPYFTDSHALPDRLGILSVYRGRAGRVWLHFLDGALVDVPLPLNQDATNLTAVGSVTPQALQNGRFEDITYTSLAPLLRRRRYYLLHAFAAAKEGRAVLIVGPSGSGKTTTGLCLLLNGWRLLANDILLLEERDGQVFALPTPGSIGVRPQSAKLLPALRPLIAHAPATSLQIDVTEHFVGDGRWADPAPIAAIYFPQIQQQATSDRQPAQRAICLAQLMAESIDRWDGAMLPAHMALLERLSQQTAPYWLALGQDMTQLPQLLGS